MKHKTLPNEKSPMERFDELGKKLMAVPKAEVDALEKKWHSRKAKRRTKKRAS